MTETATTTNTNDVAWDAPDGGEWSLEDGHGAGPTPVTMQAEMEAAFADGFRVAFGQLGMPLSHLELRHVNDWPFMSAFVHEAPRRPGKPPPDFVLKALTRLHPRSRARTRIAAAAIEQRVAQRFATDWWAERQTWIDRLLAHQAVDTADALDSLDDAAFADHVGDGIALAHAAMRRHFELAGGAVPLGAWLLFAADRGLDPAAARQAVMYGTPVHCESATRLHRIRTAVGDASPASFDEVRAVSPEAAEALDDYLDHHGRSLTEDRITAPPLAAFADLVLRSIAAADAPVPALPIEEAVAELRADISPSDHDEFDRLAADAHAAHTMLDDNSAILGVWGWGLAAGDLCAAARRLADVGRLHDPEHIWGISTEAVLKLLRGEASPGPAAIADSYATWRSHAALTPPAHLNGEPSPPPDPSVFPAPVARLVAAFDAFLNDKFNSAATAYGIGDTPAQGRAIVVDSPSDALDRIEPGDILVTTATTPAYNGVLGVVGGIVISTGGRSSHAAVVARELGVPAIVGYTDATTRIRDGALITLDPVSAEVHENRTMC